MSDQQAEDLLAQAVAAMQHASGFDQAVTLINQALGRSRLFSQAYTRAHVLQCHVALVQNYAPRRKNRSKEKALDFRNALEVLRDSLPALRRHKDYEYELCALVLRLMFDPHIRLAYRLRALRLSARDSAPYGMRLVMSAALFPARSRKEFVKHSIQVSG